MRVTMIGTGYVGLVSGLLCRFHVACVDKDEGEISASGVGADVQEVARGIGPDNRIGGRLTV